MIRHNQQWHRSHSVYFLWNSIGSWWRHQMETVFALLASCEGNPSVSVGFPSQRPVTRSFDVFFYLRLSKWFSKQSRCRSFETPWRSLWRRCNDTCVCPVDLADGRCLFSREDWNYIISADKDAPSWLQVNTPMSHQFYRHASSWSRHNMETPSRVRGP